MDNSSQVRRTWNRQMNTRGDPHPDGKAHVYEFVRTYLCNLLAKSSIAHDENFDCYIVSIAVFWTWL